MHAQSVISRLMLVVTPLALALGCGGSGESTEQHSDEAINTHVSGLAYDGKQLLNVQDIAAGSVERTAQGTPEVVPEPYGSNLVVCQKVDYSLEENFDDVAILRPTAGIIWPGALVKANQALLDGMPEPITLAPAPVTLRVDLPGIGDHGTFQVASPSNSAVQSGLDASLAWWNDNAYQDGYRNASNSSFATSTAFSSEQLALDVGLNVKWCSGKVGAHFAFTSSNKSSMAMMVYKQVFYTVTVDVPSTPASMFADSVMPSVLAAQMTSAAPPAYVHSVNYGRIIMFRMETSEAVRSADMKATMEYAAGADVDMTMETKYKSILQRASINVITIGGDAEASAEAVKAEKFGDLYPIITGKNALYSKSNPGVPIAYTVRFLKDNSVAKMGFTTTYTSNDCSTMKEGRLTVHHGGAYVARAYTRYIPWGETQTKTIGTGNYTAGFDKVLVVPAGATQVELWAEAATGIVWDPWDQIGYVKWEVAPEAIKYCLKGTTLINSWSVCD